MIPILGHVNVLCILFSILQALFWGVVCIRTFSWLCCCSVHIGGYIVPGQMSQVTTFIGDEVQDYS